MARPSHVDVGDHYGRWTVIANSDQRSTSGLRLFECRCECGTEKLVAAYQLKSGRSKSCGCRRANRLKGEDSPNWKGGKTTDGKGYVWLLLPDHPNAIKGGRILEHRLVMEQQLGRCLLPTETVHHKNGNRSDNRPENLELRAGRHGKGQTVTDLVEDALSILRQYAPEHLAETSWAMSA